MVRKWFYFKRIVDYFMFYRDDLDVGLFFGINCVWVIKLREVILGNDDDFYVKRIVFGWGVIGMVILDID